MREKGDPPLLLARVAARHHGVVTVAQLRAVGVGASAITRELRRGRLHRIHRGVYAVGHRRDDLGARWMAAVLACGEGAVLSHGGAAVLWGLLLPVGGPIDVSVPTRNRKRHSGLRVHRPRRLEGVTRRRRIPVTTPARTIADLPQTLDPKLVRRARRQAELFGLLRLDPVDQGRRTRSDLEDAFLAFLRRNRFPEPRVNFKVAGHTVDFVWPDLRLAVELDDLAYHRGDISFEDDHALEADLVLAGYRFAPVTGAQIEGEPERVAARLRL